MLPIEPMTRPIDYRAMDAPLTVMADTPALPILDMSLAAAANTNFRLLADHIPTLCWMADPDGYIFWYNRRWHDYCGSTPESMAGWGWQSVHDPAVLPAVLERWTESIRTAEPFEMVFPLKGADGVFRPFLTRVQPQRDDSGRVLRWFGINTDVSGQFAAEAELAETLAVKDMLLHEVNHRVKNSLQLVTSLLLLQAGKSDTPEVKQGLLDARTRISVVAGIHQRLYSSGHHDRIDLVAYIRELATDTVMAVGRGTIDLQFVADGEILLPLSKAVPLALITSELLTNATKYAFVLSNHGTITMTIRLVDGCIDLLIADDGCGLPEGFDLGQSRGLGMRMITSLVRQVRGSFAVVPQEAGTCFRIGDIKQG